MTQIYASSFALEPENFQPTGTVNWSRVSPSFDFYMSSNRHNPDLDLSELLKPFKFPELPELPPAFTPDHDIECAICLSCDKEPRQRFGQSCDHTFHRDCIAEMDQKCIFNCPMCRASKFAPK